jgi:hypothetical protein
MSNMTIASQLPDSHDRSATKIIRYLLYTGPASYATGGDLVNPDDVGMTTIDFVNTLGNAYDKTNSHMYLISWDYTVAKLVWYVPNTGVEVANATNLSTFTVLVEVVGH